MKNLMKTAMRFLMKLDLIPNLMKTAELDEKFNSEPDENCHEVLDEVGFNSERRSRNEGSLPTPPPDFLGGSQHVQYDNVFSHWTASIRERPLQNAIQPLDSIY